MQESLTFAGIQPYKLRDQELPFLHLTLLIVQFAFRNDYTKYFPPKSAGIDVGSVYNTPNAETFNATSCRIALLKCHCVFTQALVSKFPNDLSAHLFQSGGAIFLSFNCVSRSLCWLWRPFPARLNF